MFLLIGVTDKVKDCGVAPSGRCPVCGREGALHIIVKYMTPHIFFIPTFRFRSTYLATCGACAGMVELDPKKGRAVEKGQPVQILSGDLRLLRDNSAPVCPDCGERLPRGSAFCNRCGRRL